MLKQTLKNPKNWHNTPVVLCWHEKKFGSNKRQWISFRPQRWDIPYRNHHACCEKLWFVRSINLPQVGQKITTACWCRSMIACQVSWILDEFWIYQNLKTRYLNVCGRVMVARCRHSFPFLAWDLSMQPRTKIWIFNQFICIRACACSSNLNYAHKCNENSIDA